MATELDRMRADMHGWDGGLPEYWKPEAGDVLIGVVVRYESAVTKLSQEPVRVAIICDDETDELISVWLTRSVLRNEFERQEPKVGDIVGLKYFGEVQPRTKTGKPYHRYGLRVSRAPGSPTVELPSVPASGSPAVVAPSQLSPSSPDDSDEDDSLPF